jgi:predicted DNA-binding transcriptional regulator AlpA
MSTPNITAGVANEIQPNRHDRRHKQETILPELLTKTDVATICQVSGRQVENLVRLKKLPQPIRLGSHPRWPRAELMSFLDSLTKSAAESC